MKQIKKALIILLSSLIIITTVPLPGELPSIAITVEAHSGRTDSKGGHRDNKNVSGLGSYHYHCGGHPAHLHPNGVCPYGGVPASSSSSSTSSSSKSSSSSTSSQTTSSQTSYLDYEQYLKNKYSYVYDDLNSKIGTYPSEVSDMVTNYMNMDGVNDEFLCSTFLTPSEFTDLYPVQYSVQSDIAGTIIALRLFEIFNAQYETQQAQMSTQQQAQQTQQSQDEILYSIVTQTQTQLTALGFYIGAIDGIFDTETQQALINFQTAYGLTVDGTINQEVVAALGITV